MRNWRGAFAIGGIAGLEGAKNLSEKNPPPDSDPF